MMTKTVPRIDAAAPDLAVMPPNNGSKREPNIFSNQGKKQFFSWINQAQFLKVRDCMIS